MMLTRRRLAVSLALALALPVAGAASAASLRLKSGASLMAVPSAHLVLPGSLGSGSNAVSGSFGGGIAYVLTEAGGRSWAGTVPGTRGVSVGEPALAQNPMTGDVYLVFARVAPTGSDLAFVTWTGQSWTQPMALTSGTSPVREPALAFGEMGEAVLSWREDGLMPTLLVRHFELAPSGPFASHAFIDLGHPAALVRPAGGMVGLPSGVANISIDSVMRRAYLLVVDAATESLGVVRLDLQALYQGGGFNAPPVPVALIRPAPQSTGSSQPLGERTAEPGSLIVPWRLSLSADTFACYWMETDRIALMLFRGGDGGEVLSAPLPTDEAQFHAAAYHAVLRELGFIDRRLSERQVLRRR